MTKETELQVKDMSNLGESGKQTHRLTKDLALSSFL